MGAARTMRLVSVLRFLRSIVPPIKCISNIVHADEIAKLAREKEELEKQKADQELDDLLADL